MKSARLIDSDPNSHQELSRQLNDRDRAEYMAPGRD
jgi:hypothetical protein